MRGAGYYSPKTATTTITNAARIVFNKTIGQVTRIHLNRDKILDRVAHPSEYRMGNKSPKKSKSRKRGGKAKRSTTGSKTRRVR